MGVTRKSRLMQSVGSGIRWSRPRFGPASAPSADTQPIEASCRLLQPLLVDPFVGRSGSTLVMKVLGSSPAIAFDRVYPYEHRYITYLCRLVEQVSGRSTAPPQWSMAELLEGSPYHIGPLPFSPRSVQLNDFTARLTLHLWAAFSESVVSQARNGQRYYAEKAWGDSVEMLTSGGIRVRLVNLVRDPRDVVASIRAFDKKRGYYGFGRQRGQSDAEYFATLVERMVHSLDRMHRRARRHDHLWIRYEDLVRDRALATDRLSRWLGVDLQAEAGEPRGREYHRHSTTQDPADSVGRWHDALTSDEVSQIDRALGESMRRFGYARGEL